ncbi:MAG: 3-phosphoshikimate 1-carboxyvinyltransferase, partial [Chitinophagia bacterium]|nr:3-phosphoshikimate 1-carboxyvinyltransferase [Chitinophagia bacterium]
MLGPVAVFGTSGTNEDIMSPRSKSSMQRACAAALLRKGVTEVLLPGDSNDDRAAMDVITRLGARLSSAPGVLRVDSDGVMPVSDTIDCGESGLGIRMFTPIAALSDRRLTITGSGSLVTRPMDFFDGILPRLGVELSSNGGRLPLSIRGPLQPCDITVDGSLSSQFLTGLLMAFSAAGASDVSIRVDGLRSRPYIDLTLTVMRSFGMHMPKVSADDVFHFLKPSITGYQGSVLRYTVEGDWSGAAFLVVSGALAGDIVIEGLDAASVQGDKAILEALASAGGAYRFDSNGRLHVSKSDLTAFRFDATECPDLFPPLAALAACSSGTSVIQGVGRLAHKESDRGLTLQQEFAKLGVSIRLDGDLMHIDGGATLQAATTHSRHDHRIAMALAVAALRAS